MEVPAPEYSKNYVIIRTYLHELRRRRDRLGYAGCNNHYPVSSVKQECSW